VYQKLRKDFGRAPKFHDMPADILSETMPNPDLLSDYVERNPTDVAIQCIPEYSEHDVNTERFELQSQGIVHLEGDFAAEFKLNGCALACLRGMAKRGPSNKETVSCEFHKKGRGGRIFKRADKFEIHSMV
jgi:hypothetical protein